MGFSESTIGLISIIAAIVTTAIMNVWNTNSTNNSIREEIQSVREDVRQQIQCVREEIRSTALEIRAEVREMKEEMKDFHGRLISLEERYRSK